MLKLNKKTWPLPILSHCYLFLLENIRKPLFSWCFQQVWKEKHWWVNLWNVFKVNKNDTRLIWWDALRKLVLFEQFKKREKHPWGVLHLVTFNAFTSSNFHETSKVALLHGCFSCFLICANSNKSRKTL